MLLCKKIWMFGKVKKVENFPGVDHLKSKIPDRIVGTKIGIGEGKVGRSLDFPNLNQQNRIT